MSTAVPTKTRGSTVELSPDEERAVEERSVEVLYLVATGGLSWAHYFEQYLLPVFIGNTIGGVTLVSLLNYGQVVAEGQSEPA
ncbi:MAG: hypothetical protein ACLPYS_20150 [Vulcanimicrobiaceae bacterium]